MANLQFISADSHVQESDEFKMRIPAHYREAASAQGDHQWGRVRDSRRAEAQAIRCSGDPNQ